MDTTLPADRPVPFDTFLTENGAAEYETNWRPFRVAAQVATGAAILCVFLFLLGALTGDPVWSALLLAPIAAVAAYILHRSAAITGIRIDAHGVACLPDGPRIAASEIVWVQPSDNVNPLNDSFDARIADPRVVPIIAPMMFMGRRVGVSLFKRVSRRIRD